MKANNLIRKIGEVLEESIVEPEVEDVVGGVAFFENLQVRRDAV